MSLYRELKNASKWYDELLLTSVFWYQAENQITHLVWCFWGGALVFEVEHHPHKSSFSKALIFSVVKIHPTDVFPLNYMSSFTRCQLYHTILLRYTYMYRYLFLCMLSCTPGFSNGGPIPAHQPFMFGPWSASKYKKKHVLRNDAYLAQVVHVFEVSLAPNPSWSAGKYNWKPWCTRLHCMVLKKKEGEKNLFFFF